MSSGIAEIIAEAKGFLAAATPDVEPLTLFHLASEREDLATLPPSGMSLEACRAFQITAGIPAPGVFSGGYYDLEQEMHVAVGYFVFGDDDAYARLMRLAHADAARIDYTLQRADYTTQVIRSVMPSAHSEPEETGTAGWFVVRHTYLVRYWLI